MKNLYCLIFVVLFIGCTNEFLDNSPPLPNAQVYITKMFATGEQISRSNGVQAVNHISFHDSITGKNYEYTLFTYSDSISTVDVNCDGIEDLHMISKGNKIVGTMAGFKNELIWSSYTEGNNVIYEFSSSPISRASYKHLTWWECCTRLATTEEVAVLTLATGLATPVAAAIAVICLDERNRWEVVE